jgi:myo-inositol-1(or 4)-monophosphatase
MEAGEVMAALRSAADAVAEVLAANLDWGLAGTVPGQHRFDLAADEAALAVLSGAGLAVLSEESGLTGSGPITVVLDPVDGSTNASRGLPWYSTSACVVDGDGPWVALVRNQATGVAYEAVRGEGAWVDGSPLRPSTATRLADSVIGLSGYPSHHYGWSQFRAHGGAALELAAVAGGRLDGFVDCLPDAHGVWDYLAGALICAEAGASVADAKGRDLAVLDHAARRTPVAAATPELLAALLDARRGHI